MQVANAPDCPGPVSRHCTVTPGSVVVNPNAAVVAATVPVGPEVIVTVGAWSTS